MFIKIYFGEKPLFLCDSIDETLEPYIHHDDGVFIDELDSHTVKTMIHEMEEPAVHAGVFFHTDLAKLQKEFFKKFTLIKAGGGLVVNEKQEILLIFRRGKWDMPKGKLDDHETIEQCSVREVEEETGLKNVQLDEALTITYHTYHEGSKFILKESHWYTMHVSGQQQLEPQKEEGIDQVIWVSKEELADYRDKVFPSVAGVIEKYLAL
ncbi:MAG: NUDIX domain-containing protein [Chitinophagaceae bacterium]|nr:NUDIX domain-containing protein [Chitinophagaceae bacterium]